MHKNTTKCNETLSKWCKNKHGASKIIDTFEYQRASSPKGGGGSGRGGAIEIRHLVAAVALGVAAARAAPVEAGCEVGDDGVA
jgi:hypothetical protein